MNNAIDSWKNESVFKKQLDLNIKELSNPNSYPPHWKAFVGLMKSIKPKSILDVGCGCGAYYELCKREFPNVKYTGVDYSDEAINLAKSHWNYDGFAVKNYKDLTEDFVKDFDVIHLGALLDVLPDGDEALEYILSLNPKNVLIGRMKFTDQPSHSNTYTAYDEITTYAYHHNKKNFFDLCEKKSYKTKDVGDNFFLTKEKVKFQEKWDRDDMLNHLDEFNKLYENRPIKDNNGGMKSAHMFPSWYIVKKLKPKYLIESGVWKGLGTWFFEQASPDTKIISIDPSPHFRVYTSPNVTYQTEDFLKTDWSHIPKEDSMIFFDDHQNFLERLKHAQSLGFKRIMTEDNYPFQQGDCYTPKKILANKNYVIDLGGNKTWHKKNDDDLAYFQNNVVVYQEMPPIFKAETTRWGDLWDDKYPTPQPLLGEEDKDKFSTFFSEKKDYTWICYLEVN